MGYGDNRYGGNDDRWQTPDRNEQWGREGGGRWDRERGSYGSWGGDRDRDRSDWGGGGSRGGDDRGFFERAGEQVRSWFSDDDDRGGGYGRERMSGQGGDWNRGSGTFGAGFGGQRGSGSFGGGRERSEDEGYARGPARSNWGGGGGGADTWGGSGFGGLDDNGRRFDRIDPGHVGAQGAHPMSSPVDAGYGAPAGSYSRSAAIMSGGGGGHRSLDAQARDRMLGRGGGQSGGWGGGQHDPHYSEWRQRQIQQLDQDYEEYRREHQSKFEQEFGGWREKRQGQRQSLGRVSEHMEVIGSDGQHIGTVDKVRGDRIILTKSDPEAGGIHHSIPCSWIENVDEKVTVNKTAEEARRAWRTEEENQALFEGNRATEGGEGPHMLNRSFSGTYSDRNG